MNDFLDNLGKVVNETAKKAIKVSSDAVDITKTSLNIKFDEVKRESFFKEIGKSVYKSYKASPENVSDDVLDFCKCIDEIETAINSQKTKVAQMQNKKFCVNCGKSLDKSVNYCYSCGAKQPEIVEEESCCCCGGSDNDGSNDSNEDCGCGCDTDDSDCGCGCDSSDASDSETKE